MLEELLKKSKVFVFIVLFFIATPVFADTLLSGTFTSDLNVSNGSLSNLNDNNTGTTVTVDGKASGTTYHWIVDDLGSSKEIHSVDIVTWCKTFVDANFYIITSNTLPDDANEGDLYGSSFSTTACNSTQTSSAVVTVTARYLGIVYDSNGASAGFGGGFNGDNMRIADFNVYGVDSGGATSTPQIATSTTMVIADYGQYLFNGILLFLISFLGLIFYFKNHKGLR